MYSLFPKAIFMTFIPYFTIVQIIVHYLWDHWAHCGFFENEVLLMYTQAGVSSVANFVKESQ